MNDFSAEQLERIVDHPKFNALLNVIVFTPIAIYLARGMRPPTWLTVASLAYTGIVFIRDLQVILGDVNKDPTVAKLPKELTQPPLPKPPSGKLPSPSPTTRGIQG